MSGPRTARDALLAELLGDMDQLLTRFEQAQKDMEALRASMDKQHEGKASQAARELEAATTRFGEISTRSVDDFVAVANEALSKFIKRTNEIKDLLDKPISQPAAPAVSAPKPVETDSPMKLQPWLLALVFSTGLFAGVAATLIIGR